MLEILQHSDSGYASRTKENATDAVTVALAVDFSTAGEKLTARMAKEYGKAFIRCALGEIDNTPGLKDDIVTAISNPEAIKLNIAGNGIYTLSTHGFRQQKVNRIVYDLLRQVDKEILIPRLVCGGQTGVDLAGAVAAMALGIPCTMLYPKGFKIRFEDGVDIFLTEEQIRDMVMAQSMTLINKRRQEWGEKYDQ